MQTAPTTTNAMTAAQIALLTSQSEANAMMQMAATSRSGQSNSIVTARQNLTALRMPAQHPSAANNIQLAAAGDLQCQGFSAGCQSGGSWGPTAAYGMSGRSLCTDCVVKMLGTENEPGAEEVIILRPFLLPGN